MADALDRRLTQPDRGEEEQLVSSRTRSDSTVENALGHYAEDFADINPIKVMQQCESENLESLAALRGVWQMSYRAFHSKHHASSRYQQDTYKNYRSSLFRPKSRAAVRKNAAVAAAALFSTADAVSVKAEYEDDPNQAASAAVLGELLNYRLDRTSLRGGIPWFRVAMGAHLDAQITGVCVSKQHWDYRTYKKKTYTSPMPTQPLANMGQGLANPEPSEAGEPQEAGLPQFPSVAQTEELVVYADRPMIELLPPENVWLDLRANWLNPAQEGGYIIIRYPMSVDACKRMMATDNPHSPIEWLEIEPEALIAGTRDYDDYGVRVAREGRNVQDMVRERDAPTKGFKTVWVHENFMRFNGVDYNWWSLGTTRFLSKVICTEDAYPQFFGQRPISYGIASIEPHVIYPQSPVESWQPLQQESNDLINLHIDALRQSIEPLTKVKTGSLFDAKQLRMRGAAGANIVVRNMEDIEFDRIPEPSGSVYIQQNHLNADFDDLAGVFSGGSVQTNRSMNETVGGMRMLAGSANALSEYDLRVWVETWVEPTIRQTLQNIQYFESDEKAIALAGQRAKLVERFGISEITNDMLEAEVGVSVNVGIGAADPMQRLQKLGLAMGMLGQVAPFSDRPFKVNFEEVVREVMGAAGYKEGMKFITWAEPGEPQPDPEMQKAQLEQAMQALQLEVQERIADKNNLAKEQVTKLQGLIDTVHLLIQQQGARTEAGMMAANQQKIAGMSALQKMFSDRQKADTSLEVAKTRPKPKPGGNAKK